MHHGEVPLRQLRYLPAAGGVELGNGRHFPPIEFLRSSVEEECSANRVLSHGGEPAEVPHQGDDQVFAGFKEWSEVELLVEPVLLVAALGAEGDHLSVDVKLVAVVCGDADR